MVFYIYLNLPTVRFAELHEAEAELVAEVKQLVRETVGPIASLHDVLIVPKLPKTRSGKIARNTLNAMVRGEEYRVGIVQLKPAVVVVAFIASELFTASGYY